MKVAMKQWRPSVWTSDKAKKKKEHLCDERQQALEAAAVEPSPPVIIQALQERITNEAILSGGSTSTPGTSTPVNLFTCIDDLPAPAPAPVSPLPPSHTMEETTSRNK
jgi:hypothetical protein